MTDNYSVIKVTVFYARKDWHFFITNFWMPFFSDTQKLIPDYFLHFSDEQGDQLRYSIQTNITPPEFRVIISSALKNFLAQHPSREKNSIKPDSVFSNFQNNCFYFDLFVDYSSETSVISRKELMAIRSEFTNRIINTLSEEEIDKDRVVMFLLYILFAVASVTFGSIEDALTGFKMMNNNVLGKIPISQQIQIDLLTDAIVHNNYNELLTLADMLWSQKRLSADFSWLTNLIILCSEVTLNKSDCREYFIQTSSIIMEHLNIREPKIMSLSNKVIYQTIVGLKTRAKNQKN